ncbi:Alpha-amylase [Rhizoctonia solani]|uniref:alpha-amylase n=1 Tax=Rhizoctonia solani TaxID=456999 RepID=A0A8H7LZ43_9AGAM|nr:Alpha-amylase [Rhizoctonia solani]
MLYRLTSFASTVAAVVAVPASIYSRAPSSSRAVIIQMFEWNWDSIATECTNFIGPAGYGFVQVSPPSEHVVGSQWWTDYQPVSYTLTSKRGNRSQFQNAGVGVITDTLFNHMTGMESGTGVAGSTHYNYPGIYQNQDFHHCGLEPGDDIVNYNSRIEVQTCEVFNNLADLATETEYVRSRLAAYANDLLSLGVVGFRLDAAKHIPAGDIANILGRLSSKPYVTQEVIFGSGEPILPSEYTGNGDVQEFRYTSTLRDAFQKGGISGLNGIENRGWIPSNKANVFISNHDTERTDGASLNYKSGSIYTLAHVFMLAYPYGTPTILSSYTFSDNDAGGPSNGVGSCSDSGVRMVGNASTGGLPSLEWSRSSGFVVINNADSSWTKTFTTPLTANTYCDMISGGASGGKCTGSQYTISGGTFTTTIPAKSAVALFTGATVGGASVTVAFRVNAETVYGDNIFLVGSTSQLGAWTPGSSIPMSSASYPVWSTSVDMIGGTSFSYKYIRKTSNSSVVWESDPNRIATAPSSGTSTLNDSWR